MKETIELNGVILQIAWLEDHGDSHCGWARLLDDQTPPENGDVFRAGGITYHVGRWQRDGEELFARVYAE